MLKGKKYFGLNWPASSNNDAQEGLNLGELDSKVSVTLLTNTGSGKRFAMISNISTGGKPTLAGLISSQFFDFCIDMYIYSNAADVIISVWSWSWIGYRNMVHIHISAPNRTTYHQPQQHHRSLLQREKETHVPSIYHPLLHLEFAKKSVPAGAKREKKQRSL